ncbi:MAG: ATP-dependent metallopeptidase FtsH/Yme1/Tma family protein [Synechococcaceae bacterium WB6_3B_236]|nr:ATP-dependent metallopeptidase FtsH/Yme1/Tma family protein [Synechococcaceae bacterium WB6_3B_236]
MAIRQDDNQPNRRFGVINLVLIGVGVLLLLSSFLPNQGMQQVPRVPYSLFINQVDDGAVKRAFITQDQIRYELANPVEGEPSVLATTPIFDMELPNRLEQHGVEFAAAPPKRPSFITTALSWIVPPLIFILVLQFFARRAMGGGGSQGALSFTKSKAKVYVPDEQSRVTFADVAGVDEAKAELTEIVDFLKKPERYTAIGARIPKGVLLVGPPGTGKTLLSKAVAGEADVPFFIISGSEFVELFVGAGAARVRDLFEQAKKNAPCIVFIDEIDAVGRQRGAGLGGGNDEREQTLNQLLTEMDGFEGNTGIIIVAATNRPDVLDQALMRPGRFDRQVVVDRPDYSGRLQILGVHARGKTLSKDVDLDKVARRTPGFTGADLANLLNEAAILAARRQLAEISMDEVNDAIERVMAGPEKKDRVMSEKRKRLVAYHEAGHALVGALMPDYDPVQKISIIPRGRAGGLTFFTPSEERMESGLYSRSYLQNQMAVALGGRVAEEIVYGEDEDEVTTGASNDLQQVARVARQMVTRFGMSDKLGPVALGRSQGGMFLGRDIAAERDFSEDTAATIDEEVSQLVAVAYRRATTVLSGNRAVLDELADLLVEQETVDAEQLQELLLSRDVHVADYV